MVCIYVLELVGGKYYIGKTNNPGFRLEQHFHSGGSVWTKKYQPIRVLEIIENCDDYDEDKYTRIYMDKYGIDNVRGGSFCEEILDEVTIKMLEKMSNSTKNKCFICGMVGHFAKECGKCLELDCIDKCIKAMESFIEEKRKLEIVDPKYKKPNTIEEIRKIGGWGATQDELLRNEELRAKSQKIKNEEYLPLFDVIYKSIQLLNDKMEQNLQKKDTASELFSKFSKTQGININEDGLKIFRSLFE
jgi:hypothetical protein